LNGATLPHADYDMYTAILKVGINASTSYLTRSKRFLDDLKSSLHNLYGYGKSMLVSAIKDGSHVIRNFLCEKWAAVDSSLLGRFPTRNILPCPCNIDDAEGDKDRFSKDKASDEMRQHFHEGAMACYRESIRYIMKYGVCQLL